MSSLQENQGSYNTTINDPQLTCVCVVLVLNEFIWLSTAYIASSNVEAGRVHLPLLSLLNQLTVSPQQVDPTVVDG